MATMNKEGLGKNMRDVLIQLRAESRVRKEGDKLAVFRRQEDEAVADAMIQSITGGDKNA